MIDAESVAKIAHEEAAHAFDHTRIIGDPRLTQEQHRDALAREWPMPAVPMLARAIESVFWASLLTEEGRPTRFRLLHHPGMDLTTEWGVIFPHPLPLAPDMLVKLAHAQTFGGGTLTWHDRNDEPVLSGMRPSNFADPPGLMLAARAPGVVDIIWQGMRLVSFRRGEAVRLSTLTFHNSNELLPLYQWAGLNGLTNFVTSMLNNIVESGHGGSIWVVAAAKSPVGVRIGYDMQHAPKLTDLPKTGHPPRHWLRWLGELTGIDGAVVMTDDVKPLGFGAFVSDVTASPITLLSKNGKELSSSDKLGGGRHRSAVSFCASNAPAAAFVVSQDGRSTFVIAKPGAHPQCAEVLFAPVP